MRLFLACMLAFVGTAMDVIEPSNAACANACSGHGTCGYDGVDISVCTCEGEWNATADCSERVCPQGIAWYDHATAENVAHAQAECSNMGTCDRLTGQCLCAEGFAGLACERTTCPSTNNMPCSSNGVCMTLREAAVAQDNRRLFTSTTYTSIWDADKIMGCVCHEGYTGYDCSLIDCPYGYNPTGNTGVDEIQAIDCTCQTTCSGYFYLTYKDTLVRIEHDDTAALVQARFEALDEINTVSIVFTGGTTVCDNDGVVTDITFSNNPGDITQLVVTDISTLTSTGTTPTVTIGGGSTQTGTKVSQVCSGRGTCDYSSGLCSCLSELAAVGGTYTSSDGAAVQGTVGDCGYESVTPTGCPEVDSVACNTVGTCSGTTFECTCPTGYTGVACELFTCPFGLAWFDEPSTTDTAHASAECSNRGTCDRDAATCTCMEGFTGTACQKLECADDCSGFGTCYTMAQLALLSEDNGDLVALTYGTNNPATWDSSQVQGCYCYRGYYMGPASGAYSEFTGHNCAVRECPYGDDPQTTGQVNEVQNMNCIGTGGHFTFTFRQETSVKVNFDATPEEFTTVLKRMLVEVANGVVTFSGGSTTSACSASPGTDINIQFMISGNLPIITHDVTYLTGGIITHSELIEGTTEEKECSGQGVCDRLLGICTCFSGFMSSDGSGDGFTPGGRGDCGAVDQMYTLSEEEQELLGLA